MNNSNIIKSKADSFAGSFDISDILSDPIQQFTAWFKDAIDSPEIDPNAMVISTTTYDCRPTSRTVFLEQIKPSGFIFTTRYDSKKGKQLEMNPYCCLIFLWKQLRRQVRIAGVAEELTQKESDKYFDSKPELNKLSAWASPQSQIIPDREYLEKSMVSVEKEFENKDLFRPENWGGYLVRPYLVEFWQGRENHLHDRIEYVLDGSEWRIERLAP